MSRQLRVAAARHAGRGGATDTFRGISRVDKSDKVPQSPSIYVQGVPNKPSQVTGEDSGHHGGGDMPCVVRGSEVRGTPGGRRRWADVHEVRRRGSEGGRRWWGRISRWIGLRPGATTSPVPVGFRWWWSQPVTQWLLVGGSLWK